MNNEELSSGRIPRQGAGVLPEPTLRRLPWYLAYLSTLRRQKVEYVSTTRIADELKVAPSQIAKDLSFLGIKGKTRIGYSVEDLEQSLGQFLGFTQRHNAVMLGVGSLGAALIADSGLQRYGLNIVAGIDIDAEMIGSKINAVEVYAPDCLPELARAMNISIAVLAVPVDSAQEVANHAISCGIPAIWNFTPTRIVAPAEIVVSNTSIYSHLAVMYNRLGNIPSR